MVRPAVDLRVGIIGTGGISHAHAPGWIEIGAERHCYSVAGAPAFADRFGATVHETLESILSAVDVVDICTPTATHAELVHAALDAGRHVVCEKPLALTSEDARAVVEHADRAGLRLLPAHVVRYFPQYAAARRAVEAHRIGAPAVLRFERTGSFPTQPWFGDESQSGGIVMDQMIHDIDQALWFAGPVTRVHARQAVAATTGTVRTAHVILDHASGAISHCRGLWGAPGTAFRYAFDIAGESGRLWYDSAAHTGVEFDAVAAARRSSGDGFLPDIETMRSPYVDEIVEFARAITDGAEVRVTAADGARAVDVSRAALESLHTGRSIACR